MSVMPKNVKKTAAAKKPKGALTGDFQVVRPAVGPKRFTWRQLREAVRRYNEAQAAKAK